MTRVEVFDPPMCCSSGVCGATVDPLLAAFAADIDWLMSQGISISRHNLAQEPGSFASQPLVNELLQRDGISCLPVVLVDGKVASRGAYPRRAALAELVGLVPATSSRKPRVSLTVGGCTPGSGCC